MLRLAPFLCAFLALIVLGNGYSNRGNLNGQYFLALGLDGSVLPWSAGTYAPRVGSFEDIYSCATDCNSACFPTYFGIERDGSVYKWSIRGSSGFWRTNISSLYCGSGLQWMGGEGNYAGISNNGTPHFVKSSIWNAVGKEKRQEMQNIVQIKVARGSGTPVWIAIRNDSVAIPFWDGDDYYGVKDIVSGALTSVILYKDGTISPLGHNAPKLTNVKEVVTNGDTFAAIRGDGTATAWGRGDSGGSEPSYLNSVKGMKDKGISEVVSLVGIGLGFIAFTRDSQLFLWGRSHNFDSTTTILADSPIIWYARAGYTWAVVQEDGSVSVWGKDDGGSLMNSTITSSISGAVMIYGTSGAYAVLIGDGTVKAWGNPDRGGCMGTAPASATYTCMPHNLSGVVRIYAIHTAFAALTKSAQLVVWGSKTIKTTDNDNNPLLRVRMVFGAGSPTCPWGTYGSKYPDCKACPEGHQMPIGRPGFFSVISSCKSCLGGKYSSDGLTCNAECPAGQYKVDYFWYDSRKTCALCPAGYYSQKGAEVCISCPQGKYSLEEGSTSCVSCDAGKYWDTAFNFNNNNGASSASVCRLCEYGKTSSTGATSCTECGAGTYPSGTACQGCGAGKYSRFPAEREDKCTPCSPGNYSAMLGSVRCDQCLPGRYQRASGASSCDDCPAGRYSFQRGSDTCIECPIGKAMLTVGQTQCEPCGKGSYSIASGSPVCSLCEGGKFSVDVGSESISSCEPCVKGKYSSPGASECEQTPPGHYTSENSAKNTFIPCPAGRFQVQAGQDSCNIATVGRYAPKGSAISLPCPRGRFVTSEGSFNVSQCDACEAGKSSIEGSGECETCSSNSYASEPGSICSSCKDDFGKYMTANSDRTKCIEDPSLVSHDKMIDLLFKKGVGLYGTFAVMAGFIAATVAIQLKRERAQDSVIQLERPEVLLKSGIAGFTFGSEFFLVLALMEENRALASIILASRSLHLVASVIFILAILGVPGKSRNVPFLSTLCANVKSAFDEAFARENVPFVGAILLLSLMDVTMILFLPWKRSMFALASKGFPSFDVLLMCLCIKVVQSTASVICQIYYIASQAGQRSGASNPQAEGLFIANITLSVISALLGLIMFLLKNKVLGTLTNEQEEEKAKEPEQDQDALTDTGRGHHYGDAEDSLDHKNDIDAIIFTDNPMHGGPTARLDGTAQSQQLSQAQRRISQLEKENKSLLVQIQLLRRDENPSPPQSLPEPFEDEKVSVDATTVISGSGTLPPPPPPPPPRYRPDGSETSSLNRLNGFAEIARQKRNSLDRNSRSYRS